MLGVDSLKGKTFLDIGSGSGLFSLAAARLGADKIHSFDDGPDSVACTEEMKRRFAPDSARWTLERGDATSADYLTPLGKWDVVYSWGVLHHTGAMHQALELAASMVRDGGILFIAIYNDQGALSRYWTQVKRLYANSPSPVRALMVGGYFAYFAGGGFATDVLRRRNPFQRYTGDGRRGMGMLRDVVDWIGGYPFEVASPDVIFGLFKERRFSLRRLKTCGGKLGCNEFVFEKTP